MRSFRPGSSIQNPGSVVVWDGTDDAGRNLAGGVYFVRLETPHGCWTGKIVKLR
ncbi:hypothetical protein IBX73_07185 [candidate division WOR-3 bacterium]|nr:hypothetical protein [candidate division WOR-3 bacterium]